MCGCPTHLRPSGDATSGYESLGVASAFARLSFGGGIAYYRLPLVSVLVFLLSCLCGLWLVVV